MKRKLASIISNVLNPFVIGFVTIITLSVYDTDTGGEAIKWAAISLVFSIIPVFLMVTFLVRRKTIAGFFISLREQRTLVYIIAILIGAAGLAFFWIFESPPLLRAVFTAGVSALVIFMMVNMFWKISLHTGFAAASATVITIIHGLSGLLAFLLVLPVAWSRIELQQHTIAQVVGGGAGAIAIVTFIFRACGCY
jgi:membrane-associated phospholipid phosphatase